MAVPFPSFSRVRRFPLPALAILLALAGCGGRGAVYLTFELQDATGAALAVPGDVDRLTVRVSQAETDRELSVGDYPLTELPADGLTLGLAASELNGDALEVAATAFKGSVTVGDAQTQIPIPPGDVAKVTLRIVKP